MVWDQRASIHGDGPLAALTQYIPIWVVHSQLPAHPYCWLPSAGGFYPQYLGCQCWSLVWWAFLHVPSYHKRQPSVTQSAIKHRLKFISINIFILYNNIIIPVISYQQIHYDHWLWSSSVLSLSLWAMKREHWKIFL